jgi:hypothetical protein
MVAPHEAEINLDAYARLTVALMRAGERRDAVLAAHGLDEERWQAIDGLWQARLADAMEQGTDAVPVPPFLQDFSRALDRAQSDDSQIMSLERFAAATRAVDQAADILEALERLGVTLDDFMHASHYWVQRMAKDEELAEIFRRAVA